MGLFSGIGSIVSDIFNVDQSRRRQNDAQDFSEYMYDTRHQKEVKDLRAAGLNPTLSALGSAPAVSAGTVGVPATQNPAIAMATTAKAKAETDYIKKQAELVEAQTESASAKAEVDKIVTLQKKAEFAKVDRGTFSKNIVPYMESMPSWLKGPFRAIAGSGSSLAESINAMYKHMKAENAKNRSKEPKGKKAGNMKDLSNWINEENEKWRKNQDRILLELH